MELKEDHALTRHRIPGQREISWKVRLAEMVTTSEPGRSRRGRGSGRAGWNSEGRTEKDRMLMERKKSASKRRRRVGEEVREERPQVARNMRVRHPS